MSTVTLERAGGDALDYVEGLLEDNDLPSADVRAQSTRLYVGYAGEEPVGVGGLETYDADALLRSVVVEREHRGSGLGTAICDRLEANAAATGVERMYLLTTTAADFFAGRGYARIERTDAPVTIRQTSEFTDLCPTTATCMRKRL